MAELFYPDVSSYQAGLNLNGAPCVACKVTEGTGYYNPEYGYFKNEAKAENCYFTAYHFLSAGNPNGQASFAYSHAGKIPCALDFEPSDTRPSMNDAIGFVDAYRDQGGICQVLYLPQWYWDQIGRPNLKPFTDRGMALWSSNYTGYSPNGPGWEPYGGMTPDIWQYTSTQWFNGYSVDYNAFKGTLDQWIVLNNPGAELTPSDPTGKLAIMSNVTLKKGQGAVTPVAFPAGATKIRAYSDGTASLDVDFLNGRMDTMQPNSDNAPEWKIPDGVRAAIFIRRDAGTNDVSLSMG